MSVTDRDALEVLLELTRVLTSRIALEEALEKVTDATVELLPADHASIRLLDESRTELLSGARSGTAATSVPPTFRPGQGLIGWAVAHGESACVDDVEEDDRFVELGTQYFALRSMIAVPLWSGGHVVGVLSASSPEVAAFGDRDRLVAHLLANCVVPSIEKARLARLAVTDPHTRAFNRRYLVPRLKEEMGRSERSGDPLSLLLMDLDHFKRVNDEHGHAAGDRVLRGFADRVREATRAQDVLIRWGGEEFVLVMPDTDNHRAVAAAERIREAVRGTPFELTDGVRHSQTVSVGVATWDGREPPQSLERRADEAMYAAKRNGRDQVHNAD